MRFKLDENLPSEAVDLLRSGGFVTDSAADEGLAGAPDDDVIYACRSDERTLITLDVDFADIRTYPPGDHAGIIVLRLASQDKLRILECVERLTAAFADEDPTGMLWIFDGKRLRIRGD